MICSSCGAENHEAAETCVRCGRSLFVLAPGSILESRYEILEELGKGGMGVVYKAHDRELDEMLAIKVLRPDLVSSPEMARRFRSEIKLARRVRHRNVCAIHEYGQEGPLRFIVMEFVEGVDLKQVLKQRGPLPPDQAVDVARQVAEGLQAIHDVGIVHRDLKTANVMLDAQGIVRLMDFGIAKRFDAETTAGATIAGQIIGTPEYMSPEQARGEKLDARSDVYALGILLFELLVGRVPFRGGTAIATIMKHIAEPPPLERLEAVGVSLALVAVLRKCLAKSPGERYRSAREMGAALVEARAFEERHHENPTVPVPIWASVAPLLEVTAEAAPTPTPIPTLVPTGVSTAVHLTSTPTGVSPVAPAPSPALTGAPLAVPRGPTLAPTPTPPEVSQVIAPTPILAPAALVAPGSPPRGPEAPRRLDEFRRAPTSTVYEPAVGREGRSWGVVAAVAIIAVIVLSGWLASLQDWRGLRWVVGAPETSPQPVASVPTEVITSSPVGPSMPPSPLRTRAAAIVPSSPFPVQTHAGGLKPEPGEAGPVVTVSPRLDEAAETAAPVGVMEATHTATPTTTTLAAQRIPETDNPPSPSSGEMTESEGGPVEASTENARLDLAEELFAKGRFASAIGEAKRVLAREPRNARAKELIEDAEVELVVESRLKDARAAVERGDTEAALDLVRSGLAAKPTDSRLMALWKQLTKE